ncbi:hypothetical protein GOP47_0009795 [Adiantum capillus-veneris]|uniref:Uncharacterized protein n=1 Tax=Adiantum capillus-veneris TaxID=13818 RepID=A0A9D4UXI3_ADICA|nr:hypothetical protein GOP47_0009795 [Adiantum capillus-veneris]
MDYGQPSSSAYSFLGAKWSTKSCAAWLGRDIKNHFSQFFMACYVTYAAILIVIGSLNVAAEQTQCRDRKWKCKKRQG